MTYDWVDVPRANAWRCRTLPAIDTIPNGLIIRRLLRACASSQAANSGNGGLGGTRTHDQRLKRPLLYRLSYQPGNAPDKARLQL